MRINKCKFKKILNESQFDSNDFKMRIIADVGNTDYYLRRAIELLQRYIESGSSIYQLTDAITLIGLAKYNERNDFNRMDAISADTAVTE